MNINIKTDSNLNIANDNEFNKKQIVVLLMFTILGISIGWLGFLLFGDIGNQCKIIYVSQKEILRLEKERINEQPKEKNLFFGKINQAIELINSEAQKYKDKRSKVIFVVGDFITGEGTASVSKQVHQSVIEHLAKLLGNLEQGKSSDRLEDNRPLRKLPYAEEFEGDASPRTAAYYNVREDSSTASTYKLPAEVEFPKRSNNLGGVTIDRQPQLLNSNHKNNKQLNNNQ